MKPIVTELVDVIVQLIQKNFEGTLTENAVRGFLLEKGYAKPDIDAALAMVGPSLGTHCKWTSRRPWVTRALSLYEQYKMSRDASLALYRLEHLGLLDFYEREMVLDHLSHFEGRVGIEELEELLSRLVCEGRDAEFQRTISELVMDAKPRLH